MIVKISHEILDDLGQRNLLSVNSSQNTSSYLEHNPELFSFTTLSPETLKLKSVNPWDIKGNQSPLFFFFYLLPSDWMDRLLFCLWPKMMSTTKFDDPEEKVINLIMLVQRQETRLLASLQSSSTEVATLSNVARVKCTSKVFFFPSSLIDQTDEPPFLIATLANLKSVISQIRFRVLSMMSIAEIQQPLLEAINHII